MPEVLTTVGTFVAAWGGTPWIKALGVALIVIGAVWGGEEQKKKQKEAEEEARLAYNRSLKDRTATSIAAESPHVYVYGRARVGASIVAILTSGAKDEYKHLVCVHAAHECDAIEEVYINGRALGTLDGDGYCYANDYFAQTFGIPVAENHQTVGSGYPLFTLGFVPLPNAGIRVFYLPPPPYGGYEQMTYSLNGQQLTVTSRTFPPGSNFLILYERNNGISRVRVKKHLGAPGQAADASLLAEVPAKWPTSATLEGMCYTVIRLDLNFAEFQSGVPSIEVLLRGKKLYDPRNGSRAWSQNPALMLWDYLTSELCGVPAADLPAADFMTAANVCDESTAYGVRYQANGTVTADQSQTQVLEKMAQAMAGTIVSTTWGVTAGKYVAPVMALTQADVVGNFSYTSGVPDNELYNGVRGQYVSAENLYVPTDFEPYQNAAYVESDGSELWTEVDFPFTISKQTVHNIARIFVEDQRNGFTIDAEFSYKCWGLQIGERVTFTSAFLGFNDKVFRIINKSYSPEAPVRITMKEDNAAIWDFADAVSTDPVQVSELPGAFSVPAPGNLQIEETIYETTGSAGVRSKATLSWDAPDASIVDYSIEIKSYYYIDWKEYPKVGNTYFEFFDLPPADYDFRVRARNYFNAISPYSEVKSFTIYGLTAAPADVAGFYVTPFNSAAIARWQRTTDLDVKIGGDIEIRFSAAVSPTWEKATILADGYKNGDATSALLPLATGTYFAKFIDSTGHYSNTAASFAVTEAQVTGWTTVATMTEHPDFAGTKTDLVVVGGVLKLTGGMLFDDIADLDAAGAIDALGGIASTGTYEFEATMDLTTVATRRFFAHMVALSYNAGDFIDARTDTIDGWGDFDGGVINSTNAANYISVSDDDVTYSPWTQFMQADFSCRYAKFKTVLTSNDSSQCIELSELEVKAKVAA